MSKIAYAKIFNKKGSLVHTTGLSLTDDISRNVADGFLALSTEESWSATVYVGFHQTPTWRKPSPASEWEKM